MFIFPWKVWIKTTYDRPIKTLSDYNTAKNILCGVMLKRSNSVEASYVHPKYTHLGYFYGLERCAEFSKKEDALKFYDSKWAEIVAELG